LCRQRWKKLELRPLLLPQLRHSSLVKPHNLVRPHHKFLRHLILNPINRTTSPKLHPTLRKVPGRSIYKNEFNRDLQVTTSSAFNVKTDHHSVYA
jgi:hypothetical protein